MVWSKGGGGVKVRGNVVGMMRMGGIRRMVFLGVNEVEEVIWL